MGEIIEDMRGIIGEAQKETCFIISLYAVGNTLCVTISINMCCNLNLFYVTYLKKLCIFSQIYYQ
jgi:hypothetical protein